MYLVQIKENDISLLVAQIQIRHSGIASYKSWYYVFLNSAFGDGNLFLTMTEWDMSDQPIRQ